MNAEDVVFTSMAIDPGVYEQMVIYLDGRCEHCHHHHDMVQVGPHTTGPVVLPCRWAHAFVARKRCACEITL